jgi:hypothetical protein
MYGLSSMAGMKVLAEALVARAHAAAGVIRTTARTAPATVLRIFFIGILAGVW